MADEPPDDERFRRRLLTSATCVGIFALLHHIDHSFRGNHVGWPLIEEVNPFTFSLLVYPFLVLGIYLTIRGSARARYWLIYGLAGLILVVFVHFVPLPNYEAPRDIYMPYINPYADPGYYSKAASAEHRAWLQRVYGPHASPLWAMLAMTVLVSLIISLLALIISAIRVRRISGRW